MSIRSLITFFLVGAAAGCTSALEQQQLEGVAKDWCLTIRACEVMPVYPLTEDLQPGDVFLVNSTADQEVATYTKAGFLPLRDIVTRLPLTQYPTFYGNRYGISAGNLPPGIWQFSSAAGSPVDYSKAPRVAFPSFSFSVTQGSGINASFPISAIPVGLSLLQTGTANGTVSFGSAYTFGVDIQEVENALKTWAAVPANQAFLKEKAEALSIQSKEKDKNVQILVKIHNEMAPTFLRVVTRVYLIDKVTVALTNTADAGAQVSGGVPKSVDLGNLGSGPADVPNNYTAINNLLQGSPAGAAVAAAPGGTLKLAMATGRSVALDSTFARPLVLGYLSVDFEILKDGTLGAPATTLKRVAHIMDAVRNQGISK